MKAPSLLASIAECRAALAAERRGGDRIGFVPTMGALHAGHLSLLACARATSDCVVLSIFVNPLQFGPAEDYDTYPRDMEKDLRLAGEGGADFVFAPRAAEMFPVPLLTRVTMREVIEDFEGAARPGHFDGVLTVVAKLFNIVQPDVAVFGQKDAQQAAAIRTMTADLDFPVEILVVPTVRDPDGLALSSRNATLSDDERRRAQRLHFALAEAADLAAAGETDPRRLEAAMRSALSEVPGIDVDYVAVVDRDRFRPLDRLDRPALAAVAVRVGRTRLIDNLPLGADDR